MNTINNSLFYGCTAFPDCRETRSVPAFVEVKRAGGLELPGFEDVAPKTEEGRKSWTA